MIHFCFSDNDKRYLFLKYDTQEEYHLLHVDLTEHINLIDPICYLPTYNGIPFRQEFLWEYTQKSGNKVFYCAIGLWQVIYKFLKDKGVPFDGLDPTRFKRALPHTIEEFKEIVRSWGMTRDPRPYQFEAAYKILQWNSSVSQLATRAGKTLIAYMVFRYSMEHLGAKRILMIVPSIDLVKQGYSDFNEYAEFFKSECLWGGGKIVESSNLTIATFQTLVNFLDRKSKKYNPSFFNGYDLVFIDETHRANAKSIRTIIEQPFMKEVKLSFGMTGTLPKECTIESYCIHALLGAKIQEIRPKELMDEGYISKIHITQHRIGYKDTEKQLDIWIKCAEYSLSAFKEVPSSNNPRKKVRIPLQNPEFLIAYEKDLPFGIQQVKYRLLQQSDDIEHKLLYKKFLEDQIKLSTAANMLHTEVMMVHFFEERIDYLIDILKKCPRNTLILAQHVEYIKHIGERLKEAFPDRPVLTVHGSSKERKKVKETFINNNNVIMVANYGIMGTGITLSNLCHGVLFESFKSNVINMQSIGRGLGLSDQKEWYDLHDITDTFDPKYASKKIYLQGLERIKIYKENQYAYDIVTKTV